jgi:4-amino-4-deoxy-L-arabinose transferase-like glycosyltransferase
MAKMGELLWTALIALAAWSTGRLLLCRKAPNALGGAVALTLGLALLAYIVLLLGLVGLLHVWLLRGVVLALAAPGLWFLWRRRPLRLLSLSSERDILLLGGLLTLGVLLSLRKAFIPPSPVDLSHYHLRAPTLWLEWGRVAWPFRDPVYHYPAGMELLYALGLAVGGVRYPQMIHLLTGLVTLMGVTAFARQRWGDRAALWAGLLFWGIPEVGALAGIALVDLAWSGAEVLAVLLFLHALDQPQSERRKLWAVIGGLVGWGAAVKYSALWTALFLGLGIAAMSLVLRREGRWRRLRATLCPYVGAALLVGGFWYLRNVIRFGNPFYPFLWGGRGLDAEQARAWTAFLRQFGPPRSVVNLLRLPWDLILSRRIPAMGSGLYPYPLALIPLLAATRRWERTATLLLGFSLVYLLIWYLTGTQQMRFVLTPLTLLALLAARGADLLWQAERRELLSLGVKVLLILSLIAGLGLQWQHLSVQILSVETPAFPLPRDVPW